MKSFRLYLREPPPEPPDVLASDLSPQECDRLRSEFEPVLARNRRMTVTFAAGFAATLGAVLLSNLLPAPLQSVLSGWIIAGIAVLVFLVVAGMVLGGTLSCPHCKLDVRGVVGSFCPECGERSIEPAGFFRAPRCTACGRSLGQGKSGRKYQVRACTHCGLWLSDEGF